MKTAAMPVGDADRLQTLDVLRGFAVLGILVMNVQMFSMPMAGYFNPYFAGEPASRDLLIWSINHVWADQKFMTIFSLLFGAGILLMTTRAAARGAGAGRMHYRRMGWLLVFGLAHAYLLWHGDILFLYAVCGMLVYPARSLGARTLVGLGLAVLGVGSGILIMSGLTLDRWPPEAVAEFQSFWSPTAGELAAETAAYQGGYADHLPWRAASALDFQTFELVTWGIWRAGGLMLLGMGLFKLGVLAGTRSREFYVKQTIGCLLIGFALVRWGLSQHHATGWMMRDSFFLVAQWNYWGSLLMSLGYIGLLVSIWKSGALGAVFSRLASAGRMAFTWYIFETVAGTIFFYGHGLGLFGRVDRLGQMMFTLAVWIVVLTVAPLWLARFQYGPLEWLWRSLTYGRSEPFKRHVPSAAVV